MAARKRRRDAGLSQVNLQDPRRGEARGPGPAAHGDRRIGDTGVPGTEPGDETPGGHGLRGGPC